MAGARRTLVCDFVLVRKCTASCRMKPNASWYEASVLSRCSSDAEFFISVSAGSVWTLVSLAACNIAR